MSHRPLLIWEISGFFFIVAIGSLLHFVYEWSGRRAGLAWLAAINESTWEHLKLAFWPGLIWALIDLLAFHEIPANFWPAKFLSLLITPLAIIAIFYGYTALLGRNYLALDIATFVLAVAIGQVVSYKLLQAPSPAPAARAAAVFGIAVTAAAFVIFSYYPQRCFLFRDPVTEGYGMVKSTAADQAGDLTPAPLPRGEGL